ncbi:copper resistance D family protein [Dichotomicrobium thermohalophilum]|uniref:Putative copper resistance protein D n=1 Tax=Dichotomicrobium thermohalophilum TaxID=933063 RepID=A0A397Q4Y0_9HYPH|nr:CopD family protein [Dichotomicrobium thermohalophilum]RIA56003.1 putative copper resistance protein D [Dichotomicrobium thermohalophilum]
MALAEADGLAVLLRMAVYGGTVLAAGAVLFRLSFPALLVDPALRKQLWFGAGLIIICEPLRYLLFLQQIAGGDLALALSPSMRWIGMETPLGQAAVVRVAAVVVMLVAGLRWRALGLAATGAMIGAYLIEGHTASSDPRALLAPLLFVHLLAVHWWIGGLPGLFAASGSAPARDLARAVRRFGNFAAWAVGALVIAGGILLGLLTGWRLDLASGYQQSFLLKLAAVALILATAALNRWRLTPALESNSETGREALRTSLIVEMVVSVLILLATALAISFPPGGH